MAFIPSGLSMARIDTFTRILIITASFFAVAALALSIVGISTRSWYYSVDSNGNTVYYNLFTQCIGNEVNKSSTCIDMQRQTALGAGTRNAAALLIVAICLLGCGMLTAIAMIFIHLSGILVFIAPIVLFLAALFMVAAFVECSKVTIYNSYSAHLVQTSHVLTIFSMGTIAFASGRLHFSSYQQI